MAWSPFQRANAGIIWVEQPGDYANPIPTTSATGPGKGSTREFVLALHQARNPVGFLMAIHHSADSQIV
jgi:hypothetical protein